MNPRPTLDHPTLTSIAATESTALAAQLQKGLESSDADVYDSWFATDIMWGSPKGPTLVGYEQLNAIHHRLMQAGIAPASRFEVVAAQAPAPNVVVAQIRRQAIEPDGFSEMAMYVLVERDGEWWLAAAQNTPITA
ncbi:nuclear transport factor 2 family protein [Antrihabitans sp. YC3-6]|uniref:Nuclear transport factor 2 family protein n=1 Tax=Antrihabitans stalagmiti TaxID=2799499 RepID=A0A934U2E3_9NOCA|nr:nuclear transport factor 2 family protein [Antrihabitans stalagmiti]MBJ8339149.1 nuclear transport factor 2 family protein [Antrihabitans stalagmiti]